MLTNAFNKYSIFAGPTAADMNTSESRRNEDLDIIKGALVCIMLLYHCASASNFSVLRVIMEQIHFIHSAFLVITGFLCGYHYYLSARTAPGVVGRRLMLRAWKIFAIFAFANVYFYFIIGTHEMWVALLDTPNKITVVCQLLFINIPGDILAFEVLYLIAWFLLLAALLVCLHHVKIWLCMVMLLLVFLPGSLAWFTAFGCSGMLIGVLAREGLTSFALLRIRRYLCFFPIMLAVILWCSPYSFIGPMGSTGTMIFLLLETAVWFYSFLWCSQRILNTWLKQQIILLGQYTLPAYIFQMVCARAVYPILSRCGLQDYVYYGVSLVCVTVATWLVVLMIDRLRKNWLLADNAYRVVFQ